jgi:hypothetical protein
MVYAMISIQLCQTLIPSQAPNRVFHWNTSLGKRPVEGHILGRTVFAAWLAPWRYALSTRIQFVDADIRQVAACPNTLRQPFQYLRLCQQRDVGGWARLIGSFSHKKRSEYHWGIAGD